VQQGIRPAFPAELVTATVVLAAAAAQLALGGLSGSGSNVAPAAAGPSCALGAPGSPPQRLEAAMAVGEGEARGNRPASGKLQVATFALG
jgi:hypothetical protein